MEQQGLSTIELGAASDTTLSRASAGDVNIEGNIIYRAGGTDVPVADGGTGASTLTANGILFGNGTSAIGATAVGSDGQVLTSNGAGSAPTFQAASGGATDIDGLSDALTNSSGSTLGLGTGALAADDGSTNYNTAVGNNALNDMTSGNNSVAFGYYAGGMATTGIWNTYIGTRSGSGYSDPSTASYNMASGGQALGRVTTGGNNTAVGYYSSQQLTTGTENTTLGHQAGLGIIAQNYCVAIGKDSMNNNDGDYNTAVGYGAGYTAGAGNNTMLGRAAVASSSSATNEITLGNGSVTRFRIPGLSLDHTATQLSIAVRTGIGTSGSKLIDEITRYRQFNGC